MIEIVDNSIVSSDEIKDGRKKKRNQLVSDMFDRVDEKIKRKHTDVMKELMAMRKNKNDCDEKKKKDKVDEMMKLKKSLLKLKQEKNNRTHCDLIERLTAGGNEIPISSQEVMELVLEEYELEELWYGNKD